jgi:potassium-transporting ATPase KdpC subunit
MNDLLRSLLIFIIMSLLTGLVYPFLITGISNVAMPEKAQGSLIISKDKVIGSALIGQHFSNARYFHGRPSALGKPYDASNSGGSNFGPSNKKFLDDIGKRVQQVRDENGLDATAPVPADMVLTSASGLDPHISIETALLQTARVAHARDLPETEIKQAIAGIVEGSYFGGPGIVNVLKLNLVIDKLMH